MSRPLRSTPAPQTHFADPGEMQRWLSGASTGAKVIYACGPNLGRGDNPAAQLARVWSDRGLVTLHCERVGKSERFNYWMKRLPDAAVQGLCENGSLPHAWQYRPEGALYRLLCARAEAGEVCPSRSQTAELLDLIDRRAARTLFDNLTRVGAIRVAEAPPRMAPTIEIVATGARTARATSREKA